MPKELIASGSERDYGANEAVLEERNDYLYVGWGRDSETVQVSICQESSVTGSRELYSVPLSRFDINRMIRALRKARDQVFGSDA